MISPKTANNKLIIMPVLIFLFSCALSWRERVTGDSEETDDMKCEEGLQNCNGICTNTLTDRYNCGSCNNECAPEKICYEGECTFECPRELTKCPDSCSNLTDDPQNCGSCGNICPNDLHATPRCVNGNCTLVCEEGWRDTDGNGSCESQIQSGQEICNGQDDDGDTICDNGIGMSCCKGETGICITACDSTGSRTCNQNCVWNSCQPPAESCNGKDDDCDGTVDEGCVIDNDGDGYSSEVDCNDSDPNIHPGASESCGNGKDDNCNGTVDEGCVIDNDRDGYGNDIDCNDNDPNIHPGASESCNGKDDDCDGSVDEGACPDPCEGHCSNGVQDCGEGGVDCKGGCPIGHGEHGDPCNTPESWRCVYETVYCGNYVPQFCRNGIWQNYMCSARDCANCCGSYSSACAPP